MSKQRRRRLNRNKRTRSRRSFIRNGVEQLESRSLPGGFLDLLAGAAIAANLDLLPAEEFVPEEVESDSDAVAPQLRSASSWLQSGLSLPDFDREPEEARVELKQDFEDFDIAPVSPTTTNLLVSASLVDSFFTSNQLVTPAPRSPVTPASRPSTQSSSFSSPISQLGAGIGTGSGQGYNVTGAELPQATQVGSPVATSSFPAWMLGEGEAGASGSGSSTGSGSASGSGTGSVSGSGSTSGSGSSSGSASSSGTSSNPPPSFSLTYYPTDVGEGQRFTIAADAENIDLVFVDGGGNWGYDGWWGYLHNGEWLFEDVYFMDDGNFSDPLNAWSDDYDGSPVTSIPVKFTAYPQGGGSPIVVDIAIDVHNVDPVLEMGIAKGSGSGSSSGSGLGGTSETINEGGTITASFEFHDIDLTELGTAGTQERFQLVIDWGDNNIETFTELQNLPYEHPGIFRYSRSHTYKDDDPTSTSSDTYTITATLSDDDGGTDVKTGTVTVNNVAPTVTITSIEIIDSVSTADGGVDGQLDETEGFIVRGTVTDPGVLDTFPIAYLEVDLDFDGTIDPTTEHFALALAGGSGNWTFEQTIAQVLDDEATWGFDALGNWSRLWGNGTESDPLTVQVIVEDDDTGRHARTATPTVHNVGPKFVDEPKVTFEFDDDGVPINATISGLFDDPGLGDHHRISIAWGDGTIGDGLVDPLALELGSRMFDIVRDFTPGSSHSTSDFYPVVVTVLDDDLGSQSMTLTEPCACECQGGTTSADPQVAPEGESPAGSNTAKVTLDCGSVEFKSSVFENRLILTGKNADGATVGRTIDPATDNVLAAPDFGVAVAKPSPYTYQDFRMATGMDVEIKFTPKDGPTAANKACFYWVQETKVFSGTRVMDIEVTDAQGHDWEPDDEGNTDANRPGQYAGQKWKGSSLVLEDHPALALKLLTEKLDQPTREVFLLNGGDPSAAFQVELNVLYGEDAEEADQAGGIYVRRTSFRTTLMNATTGTSMGRFEWGYELQFLWVNNHVQVKIVTLPTKWVAPE